MQNNNQPDSTLKGNIPFNSIESFSKSNTTPTPPVIREIKVPVKDYNSYFSRNITSERVGDWYFVFIVGTIILFAWIKITFSKYVNNLLLSAFNYQLATKIYIERVVIHRRISFAIDLIYFITGSLFLLNIYCFFHLDFLKISASGIFIIFFLFLIVLMFSRILIMRFIGHIFDRYSFFSEFLYHFFIYTKVIGIVLIPFVLLIPYASDPLHNILIYSSLSIISMIYIIRLFRAITYAFNNVLLLFYLILYLCTLEILPVVVIIKLIL